MYRYLFSIFFIFVGCSSTEVVETTIKNEINDEKYLLLKGANLYSLGRKSEALSIYEEILRINEKNVEALREKAIIEGQLGNKKQSEIFLNKALALSPKDNLVLKNLGYLNFEKKNYKKSLEYLTEVSPDFRDEQDYFVLGYIEYLNGNTLNSLKHYENVEDKEIFNSNLFFDSYLKNLEKIVPLKEKTLFKIEDKIKNNKNNTIKLSIFYSSVLKKDELSERVLKNYLTYNNMDKDIVGELIKLYRKNKDEEKLKKILKLISN